LADFVIFNECPKKEGASFGYDTPFFNLSEFYQVAMIILLPE